MKQTTNKTVNQSELTVTKLSRLQREIIHELIKQRPTTSDLLAFNIAYEYEPRLSERTKQIQQANYDWELNEYNENPEFRYLLMKVGHKPALPTNRDRNLRNSAIEAEREILSNIFKAAFYRSLKRLFERKIIHKKLYRTTDPITQRQKLEHFINLTPEAQTRFRGCLSLIEEVQP